MNHHTKEHNYSKWQKKGGYELYPSGYLNRHLLYFCFLCVEG